MHKIKGHYIGECERCWYAVTVARYEAEVSTEKRSPAFWKRQFDQAENGGHHPLGGIGKGPDRATLLHALA